MATEEDDDQKQRKRDLEKDSGIQVQLEVAAQDRAEDGSERGSVDYAPPNWSDRA